jgi:hypothetical protein
MPAPAGGYLGFAPTNRNPGPLGTNSLWVARVTPLVNVTANAILIEEGGGPGGTNFRGVVYDATSNALLRTTAIVPAPAQGVLRLPLSSPLNLTGGSPYYFGHVVDGNLSLAYGPPAGAGVYNLGGITAASPPATLSGTSAANNTPTSALELDGASLTNYGFGPLDKSAGATLSSVNALATFSSAANQGARSMTGRVSSRGYAEILVGGAINSGVGIGLCSANWNPPQGSGNYVYTYFLLPAGTVNGTSIGVTFAAGDVIGLAFDGTVNALWWNKNNGAWFGANTTAGNPAANTGGLAVMNAAYGPSWPMSVSVATGATGTAATFTLRDTASALQYAPPSGFSAWGDSTNYARLTHAAFEEWAQITNSPPLVVTQTGVEMWAINVPIIPGGGGGAAQARAMVMA